MKLAQLFSRQPVVLAAITVLGLAFALLKLNGTPADQALWAEDGLIFIKQARELGISSLWISYAGYFHLYPRLIAWLSSLFDLQATPFIFLLGWFVAYAWFIYSAAKSLLQYEKPVWVGLLVVLMVAQPHSGEVFFTLTNAQWFTGGALTIYVLTPTHNKPSVVEIGLLLIAALTGPFALLLLPVLLVRFFIYKDWSERKYVYIIIALAAFIQLSAILGSDRLTSGDVDKNIDHWLHAFFMFIGFGSTTTIAKLASVVFWLVTLYALAGKLNNNLDEDDDVTRGTLLLLLLGITLFWASGLWAEKARPHLLNPLANAARYFFIPYLLVFLTTGLVVLKRPILKYIVYGALSVLAVSSFSAMNASSFPMLNRYDLQFNAYVEFLKVKNDVAIPLNPQWAASSWSVHLADSSNDKAAEPILINAADIKILNDRVAVQMLFSVDGKCSDSRYLGVEIDMSRPDVGGKVQLFWSENERFSARQSLLRYYPSGDIVVQFALPRKNVRYLRFDPMEQQSPMNLNAVHLYCLAK
jgi:hypothetical protein